LLVNDEIFILKALGSSLSRLFRIETAENGRDAVNIVKNNPLNYFQAIVLDLNMPVMDGSEAFKAIKELMD
jgi:CheY-like chemotaxis protein